MEFEEVIFKRRSVRDFSNKKVDSSIIKRALEHGMRAPSYNHLKQWDFIFINDISLRLKMVKIENLSGEVDENLKVAFEENDSILKEMYLEAIPKQKQMLLTAPELLVVTYKTKTKILESKNIYDLNCLASVWCCIENILLSLAENDVFGVTFIPQNTNKIKELLEIPQEMEVAAFIPFGYKSNGAKEIPQKEVDIAEKIHHNHW